MKKLYVSILILNLTAVNAHAEEYSVACNNRAKIEHVDTVRNGDNWYSLIKLVGSSQPMGVYGYQPGGNDSSYALNNSNGMGKILLVNIMTAASMDAGVILEDSTGWKCAKGFNQVKVLSWNTP